MDRKLKVGDSVIFVDATGRDRPALVTAVWGDHPAYTPHSPMPGANLVMVCEDEARSDTYGRQIERETSVVHRTNQPAWGRYWCFGDEPRTPRA